MLPRGLRALGARRARTGTEVRVPHTYMAAFGSTRKIFGGPSSTAPKTTMKYGHRKAGIHSTSVADAVVAPFDQGAQDAADPKTFWMPDEEKSVESLYSEFATTCESSLRAWLEPQPGARV